MLTEPSEYTRLWVKAHPWKNICFRANMKLTNAGNILVDCDSMARMIAPELHISARESTQLISSSNVLTNHYQTYRNECALGREQIFFAVIGRWLIAQFSSSSKYNIFTDYWNGNWMHSWWMTFVIILASYWSINYIFYFCSRWARNIVACQARNQEMLNRKLAWSGKTITPSLSLNLFINAFPELCRFDIGAILMQHCYNIKTILIQH
jgi:hypothetical protein